MTDIGTVSNPQSNNTIVIVDPRNLYREVLLNSLQRHDPEKHYRSFAYVSEWIIEHRRSVALVYIPAIGDGSPQSQSVEKSLTDALFEDPHLKFLILGDADEPRFVLRALDLRASGYIPTSLSSTVVAQAVNIVRAGGMFVPATSMTALASQAPKQSLPDAAELTPRQIAVARELRKGTPNKLIAYQLNLTESTVKVYVRQIMKKLKAKTRTEVAFLTNQMFLNDTSK